MIRSDIKTNVRINLADSGVTFYSDDDLNDSIQDAYDDISILTRCILKRITLNFTSYLTYYNFKDDYGLSDYLGTTAIFNNLTNRWLIDDCSLRDFDRIRRDWENWTGSSQFWAPSDPLRIAIVPKYTGSSVSGAFNSNAFTNAYFIGSTTLGTFDLYYWATAPTLSTDTDTFLIAADMQDLVEFYVTGDLIEQAQEYTKAAIWWTKYFAQIVIYKDRVSRINKSDLLLRV